MVLTINQLDKGSVYYFTAPYSSPDSYIRNLRYLQTRKVSTEMIHKRFILIELITMRHQQAQRFGLLWAYDFWETRYRKFIKRCDAIIICMMDGWRESICVADEEDYALELGKPVYYLNPSSLELEAKVEQCATG